MPSFHDYGSSSRTTTQILLSPQNLPPPATLRAGSRTRMSKYYFKTTTSHGEVRVPVPHKAIVRSLDTEPGCEVLCDGWEVPNPGT